VPFVFVALFFADGTLESDAGTDASASSFTAASTKGQEPAAIVSFSEEEITSLRLLFQFMDRKGHGYLTKDMILANGEDSGDYIDTFELDTFFEVVDADDDEKIGVEEFIVCSSVEKNARSQKEIVEGRRSLVEGNGRAITCILFSVCYPCTCMYVMCA